MLSKDFWRRNGRRVASVATQIVVGVAAVVAGAYLMTRTDGGKVVTHELVKGLIGGVIGGLAIGAFLALRRFGG